MTLDELMKIWNGKKLGSGQCVALIREYIKNVLFLPQPKPVIGAKDFHFNFEKDPVLVKYFIKIPNTLFNVPKYGDIIVYDRVSSNPFGHTDIFIKGNVWSFEAFSQNYYTPLRCSVVKHNYIYPRVLSFLRKR